MYFQSQRFIMPNTPITIFPTVDHPPIKILVTGGCGFIGSNFIRYWLERYPNDEIFNLDALTYAGNLANLSDIEHQPNYHFTQGNICDSPIVDLLMSQVTHVVHFAAESHVDRSLTDPDLFLQTNIIGTHTLLQAALKYQIQRFHHISTDEVFGSLELNSTSQFTESTSYNPRSPYSASKAASDHLVRAYSESYGLKYTLTNCSNNYGPYQFPEKMISLTITNLIEGKNVPIYGDGLNVRDWLYVTDHCRAIELVLLKAPDGSNYVVGGLTEDISNLNLAKIILEIMKQPESRLQFINDRPGHDRRYAVDWSLIKKDLGWQPSLSLTIGLQLTVDWYQKNSDWWQPLKQENQAYFKNHYRTK